MKASVAGRLRNTSLSRKKPLLPVFEAVINAFQAIEETGTKHGHGIHIQGTRQLTLDESRPAAFEAFCVSDTGIGFTDASYDSFNMVDSLYKAAHGGKGLGRFIWLKAFERVEIDSHYRSGPDFSLLHRRFTFVASDEDQPCTLTPSDQTAPRTTVRLIGFRSPYREECPRGLDVIAHRLVAHFLPLFLDPNAPAITLSDEAEELDLRQFFDQHFRAPATKHEFMVADRNFTLHGFRLYSGAADDHELVYGAHYREVITERLANFLPNLRSRLADAEHRSFAYLAFVQGGYLDDKVNTERSDFSIPRDSVVRGSEASGGQTLVVKLDEAAGGENAAPDLFADEISLKAIRDAALAVVTDDLKPYLEEINSSKEAALTRYIAEEAPQYRPLIKYRHEFIDQIPPGATDDQLETALHRQLHQRQVRLKEEGRRILDEAGHVEDPEGFYKRFDRFVSDENEIGKTALAQYVVHRRVILDLLEKALSLDPERGRYGLEKTIHSLVFPMRTTSDDVPFEQQNLWIIDERLTFHSFLSSDMTLNMVPVMDSESGSRPDILIFNHRLAFSEDSHPLTSIVVIEFKKPDRANYDEDPVSQAYRMIREVHTGRLKDRAGRPIRAASQTIPAYCYIVCDLTPPLEIRVQNMSGRRTPDNLGYYGFNESLNAYYEIISYEKILADAKKRNRILFEKLNLPTTS